MDPPRPEITRAFEQLRYNAVGIYSADAQRSFIQVIRNLVRRLPEADNILIPIHGSILYDLRFDFVTKEILKKAFDDISMKFGKTPLSNEEYTGQRSQFKWNIMIAIQNLINFDRGNFFRDKRMAVLLETFHSFAKKENRNLEDIFRINHTGKDFHMSDEYFEKRFIEPLDDESLFSDKINVVTKRAMNSLKIYKNRLTILQGVYEEIQRALEIILSKIPHKEDEIGPFYVYYDQMLRHPSKNIQYMFETFEPSTKVEVGGWYNIELFGISEWFSAMVWIYTRGRLGDLIETFINEHIYRLEFFISHMTFITPKIVEESHGLGFFKKIFLYGEDSSYMEDRMKPKKFRNRLIKELKYMVDTNVLYRDVENYARLTVWAMKLDVTPVNLMKQLILLQRHLRQEEGSLDDDVHRFIRSAIEENSDIIIPDRLKTPEAFLSPIVPDPAQPETDPSVVSHVKRYLGPEGYDSPKMDDLSRWLSLMEKSIEFGNNVLDRLKSNFNSNFAHMLETPRTFKKMKKENPRLSETGWMEWKNYLLIMLAIKELMGSLIRRKMFHLQRLNKLFYLKKMMNPTQMAMLARRLEKDIPLMEYLFLTKKERALESPSDYTTPDINGYIEDEEDEHEYEMFPWQSQHLYH